MSLDPFRSLTRNQRFVLYWCSITAAVLWPLARRLDPLQAFILALVIVVILALALFTNTKSGGG